MQRPWPVHLIAQVCLVGLTMFVLGVLGDAVPNGRRILILAIMFGYAAISIALLMYRNLGATGAVARALDRILNSGGGVAAIVAFWLVAPYADVPLLMVMVVFLVGTVMLQVAGAVQPPPAKPVASLAVLILPAAIGLYFATHWQWASWSMIPFSVLYGFMGLVLHRRLQRAVDEAHAAHVEADAATAQVAADRDARTRFLRSTVHDFMEPLELAQKALDHGRATEDPAERAGAVRDVARALDSMQHQMALILEHLQLELATPEFKITEVAIGRLMSEAAVKNARVAELSGTTISAVASRLWVWADPVLLNRAIGNLVSYAVRHSRGRRVLVGARRAGEAIRIWVLDDGAPASPGDAAQLSDAQPDQGFEIRGGWGLGLGSARRLAGLMNARVGLVERKDGGNAFWIELPRVGPKARA